MNNNLGYQIMSRDQHFTHEQQNQHLPNGLQIPQQIEIISHAKRYNE
jgi:hypothetical protein